jgi:hypothetical protein
MTRDNVTAPRTSARGGARAGSAVALAAVLTLTACGQQTAASVATTARKAGETAAVDRPTSDARVVRLGAGDAKPRLRCPTGERSVMIADFAVGAKGARTPERAAGLSSLKAGEQMVVSASGTRVWILRTDGTARQTMHLTKLRGWLLHMRESCA